MISAAAMAAYARLFGHKPAAPAEPAPFFTPVMREAVQRATLKALEDLDDILRPTPLDPLARYRTVARKAAEAYDKTSPDWTVDGLLGAVVEALEPAVREQIAAEIEAIVPIARRDQRPADAKAEALQIAATIARGDQ